MIDVAITEAVNVAATGKPSITGNPYVGQRVTADTSGIADANGIPAGAFSYQWVSNDGTTDTNIANATRQSYVLTASEQGKNIKVVVSFNDEDGYDETVTSDAKAVPVTRQEIWSAELTAAGFRGSATDGIVGYGSSHTASALSDTTFTHDSTTLTVDYLTTQGTTTTTLAISFGRTLPQSIVDTYILVIGGTEFPLEDVGTTTTREFQWPNSGVRFRHGKMRDVAMLVQVNVAAAGKPAITGTVRVGETLTANTSDISDANGIPGGVTYSYQWVSNDGTTDTDIPGATGPTYTLTMSEEGKTVKVRVTFNDGDGFKETVTSGATAAVGERVVEIWSAKLTAKPSSSDPTKLKPR